MDQTSWREIAENLLEALELQDEAYRITHAEKPRSSLSVEQLRRIDEIAERVHSFEDRAADALAATEAKAVCLPAQESERLEDGVLS